MQLTSVHLLVCVEIQNGAHSRVADMVRDGQFAGVVTSTFELVSA